MSVLASEGVNKTEPALWDLNLSRGDITQITKRMYNYDMPNTMKNEEEVWELCGYLTHSVRSGCKLCEMGLEGGGKAVQR